MANDRYEVVRIYYKSNKRTVIAKGLTESQAKSKVNSFAKSKTSMVVYFKM